ncbi:MAG TPA: carbohydrate kinase family protein [Candidatus Sulfotelmatobacter sp.]|jgi:ribokinase|nr:carbohydrate kinase family protein [Candidatus Sulfotelmatobacter sp.]
MHDSNRHYHVITVGESTIDAFMTLAHAKSDVHLEKENGGLCFRFGEKIDVERYDFAIGGNATNVAVGLSRLGIKATLCTEIGDDEFSLKIRNCLATEHVERLLVQQVKGQSNFSVIINFKGDRTLFVEDVKREHDFQFDDVSADLVYLTSLADEWRKPYQTALDFASKHEASIAFNPGSRQLHEGKDIVHTILKHTNMLFLNKEEAELLLYEKETQLDDEIYIKEMLIKIRALGPKVIVITNGKKGSYALDDQEGFHKKGIHPSEVVERTGAGDAYTSGFLAASLSGLSLPEAMEWGAWNSSSVVTKVGAQGGLLTREQIEAKMK